MSKMLKRILLIICIPMFFLTTFTFGYPGGVAGRTLKGSTPGCTCHTASPSASVTFAISGPTTLAAGATGNYSVISTYTANQTGAGMDIAASSGTLLNSDSKLKVLTGELVQPSTQTGSTIITWNFKFTAPAVAGPVTLYATGCAKKNIWNHAPNFTVNVLGSASLSLTSPAGGENWQVAAIKNITWTSSSVTNVKIEYSIDDGVNWSIVTASTPAAAGTYAWTIPNTPAASCKVRVSDVTTATLNSVSNSFTISPGAVASLALTAPLGGENWQVAAIKNITWTSLAVSNIKIEYSTDSGTNWSTVVATTPAATGSYAWTIPNTPAITCKVRVSDATTTSLNSVSNVFTISQGVVASLVITAPIGGENWQAAGIKNITWTSVAVANIKIEYSTDSGTNWSTIIASTAAAAGTYAWTVPNSPATTCKVRVSDVSNVSLNSVSGLFTISPLFSVYPISHLRQNDSNGVSVDTGLVLTVKGVVTVGNEFNSPSYLQDSTGGIAAFGRGATLFSGMVKIGDVVQLTGKIVSYNGLTEFNPVNSFTKLDSNKTTVPLVVTIPQVVNQNYKVSEAYEGKLIKITNVRLLNAVTTWAGNTNYTIISGTDTLAIRITTGTTLVGTFAPAGSFDITGALSQFKSSAPYNSGYQLLPRFIADIAPVVGVEDKTSFVETDFVLEQNYPNPFNPTTAIRYLLPSESIVKLSIYDALGKEISVLVSGTERAGNHLVNFNAANLTSGVYFYSLYAVSLDGGKEYKSVRKLAVMK